MATTPTAWERSFISVTDKPLYGCTGGRLLDALTETGLEENTVIVLWGDHGWKLNDYGEWCKHTNMEIDTHVPLILAAPGNARPSVSIRERA